MNVHLKSLLESVDPQKNLSIDVRNGLIIPDWKDYCIQYDKFL